MGQVDARTIVATLDEIAGFLRLDEESPFRVRAYERGARVLEVHAGELGRLLDEGRLTDLSDVGPSIAAVVDEVARTGQSTLLETLRRGRSPGLLALLDVPGLSPRRIRTLADALGIRDAADLRAAAEAGRLRAVRGFGQKLEGKILEGLAAGPSPPATGPLAVLLSDALAAAERLIQVVRLAWPAARHVDVVGDVRRACEVVTTVELLATVDDGSTEQAARAVETALAGTPLVAQVGSSRGEGASFFVDAVLPNGPAARVAIGEAQSRGFDLVRLTGSSAHVARLGLDASARMLATEEAVYARAGLPFIPPELRENEGELEAARAGDVFADLVRVPDIRGAVHCHTLDSDGRADVATMAAAAARRGLSYITITDHSPSAFYARGLDLERLRAQTDAIARARSTVGIDVLHGTEADILADGALDHPADVLGTLDVVIASVHNRHKQEADAATQRLCAAMKQPVFKIWGHALGRLLLERPPIACDVERVLDAARESGLAAIEINGDPHRLDLPPHWARAARSRGLKFVLSVDAHAPDHLDYVRYAVSMARRAGVRRGDVLNTLPADEFRAAVRPARV